mgnify:CR=1 FL=1
MSDSILANTPPKRIGFVSTRFHGTDGVTLEALERVVLASTFLIDHFELFGLKQPVSYALGRPLEHPAFKERLFTEIFPGRTEVPKTLIFAKSDAHADDIVRIHRAERTLRLVKSPGRSYFELLHEKLHWGERLPTNP